MQPTDFEMTKWDVEMATSDQERKWEQHLERVGEPHSGTAGAAQNSMAW
jgi:hypothetical protein